MTRMRKFVSLLLVTILLLSTVATTSITAANAEDIEDTEKYSSIDLSKLKDDEFDLNSVVVILKKEYSEQYANFKENFFAGVESKEIEKIMDADVSENKDFRNIYTIQLKKTGREEVCKAIKTLQSKNEVLYAGPNLKMKMEGQIIPNDPKLSEDNNIKPYNNISLPAAWDITKGSRDIVVANAEAIQYDHPDLAANVWTNPNPTKGDIHGYNFNRADGSVYPQSLADGHGTITAGCIGAVGNNGIGTSGVAQQVSLMSVMASGSSQFSQLINYLNEHKVEIFNISQAWGETEDPIITQCFLNYNGLVTISAGNGYRADELDGTGCNLDNLPSNARLYYPASYGRICENVITVANVDNNDNLVASSNYGANTVAIAAPSGVQTTNIYDSYFTGSGTSCSSPVVAGAAALIKSVVPSLSWQQVKAALLNNIDFLPGLAGKVKNGGRLNVYKAIKSVVTADGTYYIRNVATGKYLEATASNTNIEAAAFSAANTQQWKITNRGNHYYTISPQSNTSKYWDVNNAWDTEGNRVGLYSKNDAYAKAQSYQFLKNSDGTYRIITQLSSTRCISMNTADGSNTMLSTINDTDAKQKWVLEQFDFEPKTGTYYIRNMNSGLYLDVESPNFENVSQHSFNGANNQKFTLGSNYMQSVKNGKYLNKGALHSENFYRSIVSSSSTPVFYLKNSDGSYCILRNEGNAWKALDVYNNLQTAGAVVGWGTYTGSKSQKWMFEDGAQASVTPGTYYLKNKNSGYYLDLNESTGGLLQHGYNGAKNQQWEVVKQSNGNYKLKTKSTARPGYITFQNDAGTYKAVVQNNGGIDIGIYLNDNNTYRLLMANYTFTIVVRNASAVSGAEVYWGDYRSAASEQWELIPA